MKNSLYHFTDSGKLKRISQRGESWIQKRADLIVTRKTFATQKARDAIRSTQIRPRDGVTVHWFITRENPPGLHRSLYSPAGD
jgi:hypothetical protein